jgi:hypothetical protein
LFEDDSEDLPYDYNVQTSAIPITCSNQSATLTCRGIWWQWQKYDFDLHSPGNEGTAIYSGCDGINNAFWLVQDPYPQGPRFELGITTDKNGITAGMVDNEIGKEITLYRGYDNIFGVSGLLSPSIEEQFRGPTYEVFRVCNETDVPITMRSNGFVLILRGDNPANDSPDNPIDTQYFYSRSVRFYRDGEINDYIYVFNPFEQLDEIPETKSDDQAWWQLIESYQGVRDCQGQQEQIIVNEYRAVPGVYGKVNMQDEPDPEYEQYYCDQPKIKYTGEAARIVEYQWYHPPYVFVRGDPGLVQLRDGGRIFCGNFFSNRYLHDWGACCNSVPYLDETAWLKGAQRGPSPVERDEGSDKYLPDPPEEVER